MGFMMQAMGFGRSRFTVLCLMAVFAVAGGLLLGCSTTRPWVNAPLPGGVIPPDPDSPEAILDASADDLSMIAAVTLSGGGARAAFGTETFNRFETDFLRQNFQDTLISHALKPGNLIDLSSPWFGRTQLLAQRLDDLYRGKTFGDMWARPDHPRLLVPATDLSLWSSFEFSWDQFSRICSDLASVPLSFAVAASSAVPLALSPVTVKNYAGSCQFPGAGEVRAAGASQDADDYRTRLLRSQLRSYQNAMARPFIHLVDGGVADNLGVRSLLDRSISEGGIRSVMRKLVLITVNAERDPYERIDESDKVPSTLKVIDAMLFGTGAKATEETLGLLGDMTKQWKRELSTAAPDGQSAFAADAQIFLITVNLRDAPEAMERSQLLQIPTAFSISLDDVTRLIQAGGEVLNASPGFQGLIKSLGPATSGPPLAPTP